LHFAVQKASRSIPIRFADCPDRDGVPAKEDVHPGAAAPTVPDEVLAWCKQRYRAAVRAETRGWPDVGLSLLGSLEPVAAHTASHGARTLAEMRAKLVGSAGRAVRRLARQSPSNPQSALGALCSQRLIRHVDGLEDATTRLTAFSQRVPQDLRDDLRASTGAVRSFVRALETDCLEHAARAIEHFAAALKAATPLVEHAMRPHARKCCERFVDYACRTMERHRHEASRCDTEQTVALVRDAESLVAQGLAVLELVAPSALLTADDADDFHRELDDHRAAVLGQHL
ncbi:MAG: hypothetical protein ACE10D_12095, partial [Planctomycetota bacterium]